MSYRSVFKEFHACMPDFKFYACFVSMQLKWDSLIILFQIQNTFQEVFGATTDMISYGAKVQLLTCCHDNSPLFLIFRGCETVVMIMPVMYPINIGLQSNLDLIYRFS